MALLLHRRIGHRPLRPILRLIRDGKLRYPLIEKLGRKQRVTLMKLADNITDNCAGCRLGKCNHKPANRKTTDHTKKVGDTFYVDLCGPIQPFATNANNAFTTLGASTIIHQTDFGKLNNIAEQPKTEIGYMIAVDGASKYILTSGIGSKAESGEAVVRMLGPLAPQLPKSQDKATLREVVSDHCPELHTEKVTRQMHSLGYTMTKGAAYHKNSVHPADTAMRMVNDMTRAIMLQKMGSGKTIPPQEHPYCRHHVVRLLNMLPTHRTGTSPYERFYGRRPDLAAEREFYATVFVKRVINKDRPKSHRYTAAAKIGFNLGRAPGGRGWLVRVPGYKRPFVRHDVYFLEDLAKGTQMCNLVDAELERMLTGNNRSSTNNKAITDDKVTTDETEYEVEAIRDHRMVKGYTQYLIKWAGTDEKGLPWDNTWESVENLSCDDLIAEYKLARQATNAHHAIAQPIYQHHLHRHQIVCRAMMTRSEDRKENHVKREKPIPGSFRVAMKCDESKQYYAATLEEYENMIRSGAWVPCKNTGQKTIHNILLYGKKYDKNGKLLKYKCRSVLDGRCQKGENIEKHAPVIRPQVMRLMFAIAGRLRLKTKQFDFRAAFLNADLDEPYYIRPPPGFKMPKGCNLIQVRKAQYGAVDSARAWYMCIKKRLAKDGFIESPSAPCLFIKPDKEGKESTLIFLHVDDGIIMGRDLKYIDGILSELSSDYELTAGDAEWHLGLKIDENAEGIKLSIPAYIENLVDKFRLTEAHTKLTPAAPGQVLRENTGEKYDCPYQEAIGALLWAANSCRPEISVIVNRLSRYNKNPSEIHWKAVKHCICYLKGTKDKGLYFPKHSDMTSMVEALRHGEITGYSDSDYAAAPPELQKRSTTGFAVYWNNILVHWGSKIQGVTAQSTCEAEVVAANTTAKEAQYIRKVVNEIMAITKHGAKHMRYLCRDTKFSPKIQVPLRRKEAVEALIRVDNQAAVTVSKTGDFTQKLKHMQIRYYYLAAEIREGRLAINHVPGVENPADLFTKFVKRPVFDKLITKLIQ